MNKLLCVGAVLGAITLLASSASLAETKIEATGTLQKAVNGARSEPSAKLVTVPMGCHIGDVTGKDAAAFWIESDKGALLYAFDSLDEAKGYPTKSGIYRVVPKLTEGAGAAKVTVTFVCG